MKGLQDLLQVILEDSREPTEVRLKKKGFTSDEIASICSAPGADKAILSAAVNRFVLPQLPSLLKRYVELAVGGGAGSGDAGRTILGLFARTGPLAEQLGDLAMLTDDGLNRHLQILMTQLQQEMEKTASPPSSARDCDEGSKQ